jgi:hypothetical protein
VAVELFGLGFLLGTRREPGELRVSDEAGRGVEEDESRGPFRIGRGKKHTQRPGVSEAEYRRALGPDRIHHGTNVVHSGLEWRHA